MHILMHTYILTHTEIHIHMIYTYIHIHMIYTYINIYLCTYAHEQASSQIDALEKLLSDMAHVDIHICIHTHAIHTYIHKHTIYVHTYTFMKYIHI
jgi:hypothetical protein